MSSSPHSPGSLSADDLGCWMKPCKGDIPPALVGASLTFYQPSSSHPGPSRVFLFGGRLVDERRMMNHLYVLDMRTLVWRNLINNGEGDGHGPTPRYFHSMEVWRDNLVLFGGMGYDSHLDAASSIAPPPLVGLADLFFFHIPTSRWRAPVLTVEWNLTPRYAHISAVTANRLVIVGGQDIKAVYVQEVSVFDLEREEWVATQGMGGGKDEERGMYRSACVSGERGTDGGGGESKDKEDIMLYSNYNFTDVRRVLEILHPDGPSPSVESFSLSDRSGDMRGYGVKNSSPQGLRFPSGARLGNWLLFGGIYLASSVQEYCLWALDLGTREWKPVEMGKASCLQRGSWNRGLLDPVTSTYLIFGSNDSQMLEDYNKRATNYSHVVSVDLESFGVYRQPKSSTSDPRSRIAFSEFEDEVTTDFDVICEDGRRLRCSRRILEERWPWFATQRQKYAAAVSSSSTHSSPDASDFASPPRPSNSTQNLPRARVRNAQFHLQEPYPVVLAFLQYMYTLALDTPVQNAPPVLSSLLVMSQQYELPHLRRLVVHRMHQALRVESAEGIAEVASICQCEGLMIRAWRLLGSGNGTDGDGALAAVRMSRGGSGSGGASGVGRNGSYDSGFGGESRSSASGRASSGVGARNNSTGSGVPSYGYKQGMTSPTDIQPGLPLSSTRTPLTRRGSEPPGHRAQPSTASSHLSSTSGQSASSADQPGTRQRTISEGSSQGSSPAPSPLASPGPGFLQGRGRAYSLGRTALVPSPLSTSTTPPTLGPHSLPASVRPFSTSTADTSATDSLRSPDRDYSVSSHGPVTPNETDSFPFPDPSSKTLSAHAAGGMQRRLSVLSRQRSDSLNSSEMSGSQAPTGQTQGGSGQSPNSLASAKDHASLVVPSPGSESGSVRSIATSTSTIEPQQAPVRRGSFAISAMFAKKKRPSDLERSSDGGPLSPPLPSPTPSLAKMKASPKKPAPEPISRAFGWKSAMTIDQIPPLPTQKLPATPAIPSNLPRSSPPAVELGPRQHINGLTDAPTLPPPSSQQARAPSPLPPPTSAAPVLATPSSVAIVEISPRHLDDLVVPTPTTTTPTSFDTLSQHPSTIGSSSLPTSSLSSTTSDSLRPPSSSRTTSVPLTQRKSSTPSLAPSSTGSSSGAGGSSFLSSFSLTPNKHVHDDSKSQTRSVSSSGSGGKSSKGAEKEKMPEVFVYGRGGAGRMKAVKPVKTEAERVREKRLKQEGKKKVDAFWA